MEDFCFYDHLIGSVQRDGRKITLYCTYQNRERSMMWFTNVSEIEDEEKLAAHTIMCTKKVNKDGRWCYEIWLKDAGECVTVYAEGMEHQYL